MALDSPMKDDKIKGNTGPSFGQKSDGMKKDGKKGPKKMSGGKAGRY